MLVGSVHMASGQATESFASAAARPVPHSPSLVSTVSTSHQLGASCLSIQSLGPPSGFPAKTRAAAPASRA